MELRRARKRLPFSHVDINHHRSHGRADSGMALGVNCKNITLKRGPLTLRHGPWIECYKFKHEKKCIGCSGYLGVWEVYKNNIHDT